MWLYQPMFYSSLSSMQIKYVKARGVTLHYHSLFLGIRQKPTLPGEKVQGRPPLIKQTSTEKQIQR